MEGGLNGLGKENQETKGDALLKKHSKGGTQKNYVRHFVYIVYTHTENGRR